MRAGSCRLQGESRRGVFKNPFRVEFAVIKVEDLAKFKGKEQVGIQDLMEAGFIKKIRNGVKLLSDGEIDFPIKITVHKASQEGD